LFSHFILLFSHFEDLDFSILLQQFFNRLTFAKKSKKVKDVFCCVATQQSCESFSKSAYQKLRTSKKKKTSRVFITNV